MTKVLVVDDEPQIARALRINLAARGYDLLRCELPATGGVGYRTGRGVSAW
jgi:two-component system KDP operon response regulator KdpE